MIDTGLETMAIGVGISPALLNILKKRLAKQAELPCFVPDTTTPECLLNDTTPESLTSNTEPESLTSDTALKDLTFNTDTFDCSTYNTTPDSSIKRSLRIKKRKHSEENETTGYEIRHRYIDSSTSPFCDRMLCIVDPQTYHQTNDEDAKKILQLTQYCQQSQIDSFRTPEARYVVFSWLSIARIFEYQKGRATYHEVKRIPKRFFELSSKLITSVHQSNLLIYIAYLWGSNNQRVSSKRPFVQVRALDGCLMGPTIFYDSVVKSIRSDRNNVYVRTNSTMYRHRKSDFSQYETIDFRDVKPTGIDSPIVDCYFKSSRILIVATHTKIYLTSYIKDDHKIVSEYKFKESSKVIMLDKGYRVIHVVRNLTDGCEEGRIDIYRNNKGDETLEHKSTLRFRSTIIQTQRHGDKLFILGRLNLVGGYRYAIGCIGSQSYRLIWTTNVPGEDVTKCTMVIHDDHIALIRKNQEIHVIKLSESRERVHCKACDVRFLTSCDYEWHIADGHRNLFYGFKPETEFPMNKLT